MHVREWRSNAECDFVDASHNGYAGITHRRRVMFVKPDYWVVVDDVTADTKRSALRVSPTLHQIDLGFQFAPMAVSRRARSMGSRADAGRQYVLDRIVRARGDEAAREDAESWRRFADGCRPTTASARRRRCWCTRPQASLPWRSITLLMPQRGDRSSVPAVSALFDDHDLPIGIELEDRPRVGLRRRHGHL